MHPIAENPVNTPAFLGKLWKMVNDPSTDHLICWSVAGNSFVIQNQAQFWYELLPLYYKHNNMSSFVRQLNMYGFHKMSTVDNGTMDADKDEIQFTHPYFQRDQPELLLNIKRKATTTKASFENNGKHDDLSKVLTDVKQLRGRQANVDSQLNALKQENALLWQEVAMLRQKHLKQQKIVNKLIHFLVSLVQPSRMSVGVKRGYKLMLHEGPHNKKTKLTNLKNSKNTEGPTIHELDNELDLTNNLYEDEPLINSPSPSQPNQINSPLPSALLDISGDNVEQWEKPEYVEIHGNDIRATSPDLLNDNDLSDDNLISTLENEVTPLLTTSSITNDTLEESTATNPKKIFLNPSSQNTLLSGFIKQNSSINNKKDNNCYNQDTSSDIIVKTEPPQLSSKNDKANLNNIIATCDHNFSDGKSMPSTSDPSCTDDLNAHIESTQFELDQLKDILNGYNAYVDANTLLGELYKNPQNYKDMALFNSDNDLPISPLKNSESLISTDPLVSGSELQPYANNFDFTELFEDDDIEPNSSGTNKDADASAASSTVNTPQILREEPIFPIVKKKTK